ncbi:hypothetical protein LZ30DRAFT_471092 [Colletotrichum cereale]|nr:hypothetical protein LZ30DRAFT_471092 [Colletotrichum cereale]
MTPKHGIFKPMHPALSTMGVLFSGDLLTGSGPFRELRTYGRPPVLNLDNKSQRCSCVEAVPMTAHSAGVSPKPWTLSCLIQHGTKEIFRQMQNSPSFVASSHNTIPGCVSNARQLAALQPPWPGIVDAEVSSCHPVSVLPKYSANVLSPRFPGLTLCRIHVTGLATCHALFEMIPTSFLSCKLDETQ